MASAAARHLGNVKVGGDVYEFRACHSTLPEYGKYDSNIGVQITLELEHVRRSGRRRFKPWERYALRTNIGCLREILHNQFPDEEWTDPRTCISQAPRVLSLRPAEKQFCRTNGKPILVLSFAEQVEPDVSKTHEEENDQQRNEDENRSLKDIGWSFFWGLLDEEMRDGSDQINKAASVIGKYARNMMQRVREQRDSKLENDVSKIDMLKENGSAIRREEHATRKVDLVVQDSLHESNLNENAKVNKIEVDLTKDPAHKAACDIQRTARGKKARENVSTTGINKKRQTAEVRAKSEANTASRAACQVQKIARGRKARNRVNAMRKEKKRGMAEAKAKAEAETASAAACDVQRIVRGKKARKRVNAIRTEKKKRIEEMKAKAIAKEEAEAEARERERERERAEAEAIHRARLEQEHLEKEMEHAEMQAEMLEMIRQSNEDSGAMGENFEDWVSEESERTESNFGLENPQDTTTSLEAKSDRGNQSDASSSFTSDEDTTENTFSTGKHMPRQIHVHHHHHYHSPHKGKKYSEPEKNNAVTEHSPSASTTLETMYKRKPTIGLKNPPRGHEDVLSDTHAPASVSSEVGGGAVRRVDRNFATTKKVEDFAELFCDYTPHTLQRPMINSPSSPTPSISSQVGKIELDQASNVEPSYMATFQPRPPARGAKRPPLSVSVMSISIDEQRRLDKRKHNKSRYLQRSLLASLATHSSVLLSDHHAREKKLDGESGSNALRDHIKSDKDTKAENRRLGMESHEAEKARRHKRRRVQRMRRQHVKQRKKRKEKAFKEMQLEHDELYSSEMYTKVPLQLWLGGDNQHMGAFFGKAMQKTVSTRKKPAWITKNISNSFSYRSSQLTQSLPHLPRLNWKLSQRKKAEKMSRDVLTGQHEWQKRINTLLAKYHY